MRRRMAFAVVLPLVVVAALVGLRLTTAPDRSDRPPPAASSSWEDSLRFAITADRMLRVSTTRPDVCLSPDGGVQPIEDGLQVALRRGAVDHCTGPDAGRPVDVALPAGLDVTKVTRVVVVSGLTAYPSYDVDNALYDSDVTA